MATTGYTVQQEAMAKGAQALEEAQGLIGQQLAQLDTEVNTMFSGWNSQAQKAFAGLHQNWDAQQRKLQTALARMHEALVSTGQTYVTQEDQQSSAFRHIAGSL